jgi:hypothetical protein
MLDTAIGLDFAEQRRIDQRRARGDGDLARGRRNWRRACCSAATSTRRPPARSPAVLTLHESNDERVEEAKRAGAGDRAGARLPRKLDQDDCSRSFLITSSSVTAKRSLGRLAARLAVIKASSFSTRHVVSSTSIDSESGSTSL